MSCLSVCAKSNLSNMTQLTLLDSFPYEVTVREIQSLSYINKRGQRLNYNYVSKIELIAVGDSDDREEEKMEIFIGVKVKVRGSVGMGDGNSRFVNGMVLMKID